MPEKAARRREAVEWAVFRFGNATTMRGTDRKTGQHRLTEDEQMTEQFKFANADELATELAGAVAKNLADAIEKTSMASLAVSGGSTPKLFFTKLGAISDLNWSRITITLVDERWVDEHSERSNARLVIDNLLKGPAAAAKFIPLFSGGETPDPAQVLATNEALKALPLPLSAAILGMGNDGHTASFFPGGDTLQAALGGPGPALAIRAPGASEPRVTLTLPFLQAAKNLYLHIQGPKKAETLERARTGGDVEQMPVRAVLNQKKCPLHVYWCP